MMTEDDAVKYAWELTIAGMGDKDRGPSLTHQLCICWPAWGGVAALMVAYGSASPVGAVYDFMTAWDRGRIDLEGGEHA